MNFQMSELEIDDVAYLTCDNTRVHKTMTGCSSFCHCGLGSNKRKYSKQLTNPFLNFILNYQKFIFIIITLIVNFVLFFIISAFYSNNFTCTQNNFNLTDPDKVIKNSIRNDFYTSNGELFPWNNIRLPTNIIPIHYDLFMHPNLTTFQNKGSVEILINVLEKKNFIVLHINDLNITDLNLFKINFTNQLIIKIHRYLIHKGRNQLYIELVEDLENNENYTLKINFNKHLRENLDGIYLSSYTDLASNRKRYLVTTQFEPTFARSAFPCFDEPLFKATFALKIVHELFYEVYFNSDQQTKAIYNREGLRITAFDSSVKMSTYLVAFVVCDFKIVSDRSKDGTLIRVIVPRDQYIRANFALKTATSLLNFYLDFFSINYPLSKLDLIAIPDFSPQAMENWGLITFRTTSLLFDQNLTSNKIKETIATIIAHELSHQWFGNLVTMNWWNDLWLSESLATYVGNLGVNYLYPNWNMLNQFFLEVTRIGLLNDCFQNSHAIHDNVNNSKNLLTLFDQINYHKGASLFRMLENFLSLELLRVGLKNYLYKHQYSTVTTDDLWKALSRVMPNASINITAIMDRWVRQKGYPLVTAIRQRNKVFLTQKKYFCCSNQIENTNDVSPFGYQWIIPITILTSKEPRRPKLTWLGSSNSAFILDNGIDWFKLNINCTGFFRVNYDEQNWFKLIDLLQKCDFEHHVLSAADRAHLIDDVFALMRSNDLAPEITMNLTQYLEVSERDYIPWQSAIENFNILNQMMFFNPLLHKYIRKIVTPSVTFFQWKYLDLHKDSKLRSTLFDTASIFGEKNTIKQANMYFQNIMKNNFQIPPDLRYVVYSTGIRTGGIDEWNFCWTKYINTEVPHEQSILLKALTQSRDPWLINRLLNYTLDKNKIKPQDASLVIINIAHTPIGRTLVWKFVRENWDDIKNLIGLSSLETKNILNECLGYITSEFEYNELHKFFNKTDLNNDLQFLEQTLEKIKNNIFWKKNVEKRVIEWLRKVLY